MFNPHQIEQIKRSTELEKTIAPRQDYRIGNFDRELSVAEMLDILAERRCHKTNVFEVKYQPNLYFSYVVMRDDPAATYVFYCLLPPDAVRDSQQISA